MIRILNVREDQRIPSSLQPFLHPSIHPLSFDNISLLLSLMIPALPLTSLPIIMSSPSLPSPHPFPHPIILVMLSTHPQARLYPFTSPPLIPVSSGYMWQTGIWLQGMCCSLNLFPYTYFFFFPFYNQLKSH